ncbi:MAG: hypothetical protein ACK4N5_22420, partial [Myxococcales bacterium]
MSCAHQVRRNALMRSVFSGEADARAELELKELADVCAACGAAFDRVANVERQLGAAGGLSSDAASRVLGRVLAQSAPVPAEVVPLRHTAARWAPVAVATGLATLIAP